MNLREILAAKVLAVLKLASFEAVAARVQLQAASRCEYAPLMNTATQLATVQARTVLRAALPLVPARP
jgi:hypothetical protein